MHRSLLVVCSRQVVSQQRLNGCHVSTFSSMLGVALCHKSASSALSPIMPITPANIVQHLLTSPDFARIPQDNADHHQALQAGGAPTAVPVSASQRGATMQPKGRYADIQ
jgi:hypothetical protein